MRPTHYDLPAVDAVLRSAAAGAYETEIARSPDETTRQLLEAQRELFDIVVQVQLATLKALNEERDPSIVVTAFASHMANIVVNVGNVLGHCPTCLLDSIADYATSVATRMMKPQEGDGITHATFPLGAYRTEGGHA